MSLSLPDSNARGSGETWPIGGTIVLVAFVYIPRLIYRQVALMEPTQESDLRLLSPEFREKVTQGYRPPGVAISHETSGPTRNRRSTRRRYLAVPFTVLAADELTFYMDKTEEEMQRRIRGKLTNSAALSTELFPVNFRPMGRRGERPITREVEREAWEDIRQGRTIPSSPRVSVATECTHLNRTIWDPQPFLILVPEKRYWDFLSVAATVLQLDAVSIQISAEQISISPTPMGELNHKGAFLEILCSLSPSDSGSFPTIGKVVEMKEPSPKRPLPGPSALQSILEILQDSAARGEEAPWWVPRLPPPPRS